VRSITTILAALAAALAFAGVADARTLRLGFLDGLFTEAPAARDPWLDRAAASGSDVVRVATGWGGLARERPARPRDPADPAYDWAVLDETVRAAQARGLEVILGLTGAPPWAEGPRRPARAYPGAWRPDAQAYGDFARALALRYSGRYDGLPRVRLYQPWNEPNLDRYLAPQWVRRDRRWRPASPGIYRSLLNAFARGVKEVDRTNLVLAGTTAPFGDPFPGGERMQPARFVRALLSRPTVFDVLTHHPYSTRGPFAPALNGDDVSIPDLAKLTRPLRRAERAGRISPRGRKRVWVTEVSFDSRPPDPQGVPARRHAQWLAETFFVLWRQGVDLITWFQIRDQAPDPSYGTTYQSGVYLRDGTPKLAQRAFAFPMVARRGRARAATLWARAPAAGRLVFERRSGGRWREVAAASAARHGVVTRRARLRRGTLVRARLGDTASLSARVR
jgi:Cellulase (glycosyl hydrolase family 5)